MALVSGCYQWVESPAPVESSITTGVNFRIYAGAGIEERYSSITVSMNGDSVLIEYGDWDVYYNGAYEQLYDNRLIDFGDEDQEISDAFSAYFFENARECDWETTLADMYEKPSGIWRWNDILEITSEVYGFITTNIVVNGTRYDMVMIGDLLGSGYPMGILAVNDGADITDLLLVYIPEELEGPGWCEPIALSDFFTGTATPVPNEACQTWDLGEGAYIDPMLYEYLVNNATQGSPRKNTDIFYQGEQIASVESGKRATLCCNGKSMLSDIVITTPKLFSKTITPKKESQEFVASDFFAGYDHINVKPIPDEYIIPEGTYSITKNGTYGVTNYASARVNVPVPEGYVQPSGTVYIYSNGEHNVSGKATANVNVPIPSGYLKPEGDIKITGNVTKKDIAKYATVTVEVPEFVNGVVHEYKVKSGANVNAGDFVEFFMKYGSGQFGASTATEIQIYKLDDERVVIGYVSATNYGNVVVVQVSKDGITVGTPVSYHLVGTKYVPKDRFVTVVNNNRIACLFNYSNGDFMPTYYIDVYAMDVSGVTLTKRTGYNLYDNDAIEGAAMVGIGDNRVFVTGLGKVWPNGTHSYYSGVYTISSSGTWSSVFTAKVGYAYTSSNIVTKLSNSKVLCTWVDSKTLKAGAIGIGESAFEVGTAYSISDVTSFAIKAITNDKAVLITKNSAGAAQARILTIGGTTVTAGTTITLCESCTGALAVATLSDTKAIALYNDVSNASSLSAAVLYCEASTASIINSSILETTTASSMDITAISSESAVLAYTNSDGSPLFTNISIQDNVPVLDAGESGSYVYPATSNLHNVGVAKTSGTEGETVEVYRVV